MDWTGILGLVNVLALIIGLYLTNKRTKTQNDVDLSEASLKLLKPYMEKTDAQEQEIKDIKYALSEILRGAHILVRQLKDHNIEPLWTPPDSWTDLLDCD
jgi:hypothetical protein